MTNLILLFLYGAAIGKAARQMWLSDRKLSAVGFSAAAMLLPVVVLG